MVGEPLDLDVLGLEWDELNESHVRRHGVRRQNVADVFLGSPKFFLNYPEREGSHVMVGPAASGVFFFVTIRRTDEEGI